MILDNITSIKSAKIIGIIILFIFSCILIHIVYDRHKDRRERLVSLDEDALVVNIKKIQKKTKTLRKSAQLHPVWKNWQLAKDIAVEYNMTLLPSPTHQGHHQNTWIGSLKGEPIMVLATAMRIQEQVASHILLIDYMGESARLDIAVYGTDET